jgi:hypothetical protein
MLEQIRNVVRAFECPAMVDGFTNGWQHHFFHSLNNRIAKCRSQP